MLSYLLGASWLHLIILSITPAACAFYMQNSKSEFNFMLAMLATYHYAIIGSGVIVLFNRPAGLETPSVDLFWWIFWWAIAAFMNSVMTMSCRDNIRTQAVNDHA